MMHMLAEWLQMGGYAAFVWPAYGLSALILGGLAWFSWRRYRHSAAMLAQIEGR